MSDHFFKICIHIWFWPLTPTPLRLVDPSKETLEAGLTRELLEELGVAVPISIEDHVSSCYAPPSCISSSSRLITHFYVKNMEEEQVREVERTAASTATDHGLEVMYVHGCFFIFCDWLHSPNLTLYSFSLSYRFLEWSEFHSTPWKLLVEAFRSSCRTRSSAMHAPS